MKLPVNYNEIKQTERRKVREEYVRIQQGKCSHCGAPLDKQPCSSVRSKRVKPKLYPKGFFDNPVHLHHSHVTGLTIGAVHCYCNAVLWEYYGE
jgi:hypothetical protein